MFSAHAFSKKRAATDAEADMQQKPKVGKTRRSHEDTPERDGLDDVFQ